MAKATDRSNGPSTHLEKPASVAFLPYVGKTFNHISKLLSKHNIKSVGLPLKKIPSFLQPAKDDLGLKTPGMYSMPCKCGEVCIGQTSCSINTRIKKHQCHIHMEQPEKSAMVEHSINLGHYIKLQDTTILSTKRRYTDWMIKEATDIELHLNNINREDGLHLSWSWKPLIHTLKGYRKHQLQYCQSLSSH
jgi:hypothetical protein